MPDTTFGPLVSFTDVEKKVLDHYKLWMHTWLAARERSQEIPVNTIARPRSYLVKQAFSALPGEEQTPIVICVSSGFADEPVRRGRGGHDVLFRFGIAAVCMGNNGNARALCGHYQAALLGIALRHQRIDNSIRFHDLSDLRIEDIDDEALGRSMAAVRLEVVYFVENFADEFPALDLEQPPVDPEEPQPDPSFVETILIDVQKYGVDEDLPEVVIPGDFIALQYDTVLYPGSTLVEEGVEP